MKNYFNNLFSNLMHFLLNFGQFSENNNFDSCFLTKRKTINFTKQL